MNGVQNETQAASHLLLINKISPSHSASVKNKNFHKREDSNYSEVNTPSR
mgnify:CR=1 FL=1